MVTTLLVIKIDPSLKKRNLCLLKIRRRNIEEGRGAGIGDIFGKIGGTSFGILTCPMWESFMKH